MTCGIYSITNKNSGKIYVGQSVNVEQRFREHKWKLSNRIHENEHLQNAWDKYGRLSFEFGIIEECKKNQLNSNEIWWINYFESNNRKFGYNKESGGNSNYLVSDETRKKISQSNNTTGFYRVFKIYQKTCRQGFTWGYKYFEEGKEKVLTSISLHKLRERVLSKNLPWIVVDIENANESLNFIYGLNGRVRQSNNHSGYYRVGKQKNKECKQGFIWRYAYSENGKRKSLVSVSISKLREKVVENGLEWRIINMDKAKENGILIGDDL